MNGEPRRALEVQVKISADSWEDVVEALECAANDLKSSQATATGGHLARDFYGNLERTCEWFNKYDHRPEITHESHKKAVAKLRDRSKTDFCEQECTCAIIDGHRYPILVVCPRHSLDDSRGVKRDGELPLGS
jgi:hypothetical protein